MFANSTLPLFLQVSIAIVHPLVALVGLTGSALIVALMPRAAVCVSRSAKLYYTVIAVADALALLFSTVLWSFLDDGLLLLTGNRFSVRIARYSHESCKLFYLLTELTESLSNYTIVALALERCLVIYFPLRAKRFVRLRFSVTLIALAVTPAWLCSFISVPFIVNKQQQPASQSGYECEKKSDNPLTAPFTVALTLLSYVLHTILNIILVTLISIKLALIRYKRNAMIRDKRIHLADRNSKAISIDRNSRAVSVDRTRNPSVESRILNSKLSQINQSNQNHNAQSVADASKVERVHFTNNLTNASESGSGSPRLRERSPSNSRHPRVVHSLPVYKHIPNELSSDHQHEEPSSKSTTNSSAIPEILLSELNSSSSHTQTKSSQLSADNNCQSSSGSPQTPEPSVFAAGLSGAPLDSDHKHSVPSNSNCSLSEARLSPRIDCKSLEEMELKPLSLKTALLNSADLEADKLQSSSPSVAHAQLLSVPAVSQNRDEGESSQAPQKEQLTVQDPVVARARSLSPNSSRKRCTRGGVDYVGVVRANSSTGGRHRPLTVCVSGTRQSLRPTSGTSGSDSGVGIGATVVMVLLAAINVSIYLPAAILELMYLNENTATNILIESFARFLFENLCVAHALNFFVYVARIPSFRNELLRLFCFLRHSRST